MKKTVYPQRSQVVNEIFTRENHPDKILIVPLDYAKTNHTVQFCFATIKNIKDKLKGYDFSGIKDENNYLLKEEKTIIFFSNYLRRRGLFLPFFQKQP